MASEGLRRAAAAAAAAAEVAQNNVAVWDEIYRCNVPIAGGGGAELGGAGSAPSAAGVGAPTAPAQIGLNTGRSLSPSSPSSSSSSSCSSSSSSSSSAFTPLLSSSSSSSFAASVDSPSAPGSTANPNSAHSVLMAELQRVREVLVLRDTRIRVLESQVRVLRIALQQHRPGADANSRSASPRTCDENEGLCPMCNFNLGSSVGKSSASGGVTTNSTTSLSKRSSGACQKSTASVDGVLGAPGRQHNVASANMPSNVSQDSRAVSCAVQAECQAGDGAEVHAAVECDDGILTSATPFPIVKAAFRQNSFIAGRYGPAKGDGVTERRIGDGHDHDNDKSQEEDDNEDEDAAHHDDTSVFSSSPSRKSSRHRQTGKRFYKQREASQLTSCADCGKKMHARGMGTHRRACPGCKSVTTHTTHDAKSVSRRNVAHLKTDNGQDSVQSRSKRRAQRKYRAISGSETSAGQLGQEDMTLMSSKAIAAAVRSFALKKDPKHEQNTAPRSRRAKQDPTLKNCLHCQASLEQASATGSSPRWLMLDTDQHLEPVLVYRNRSMLSRSVKEQLKIGLACSDCGIFRNRMRWVQPRLLPGILHDVLKSPYFQSRKYEVFPAVFYLHFKVCELQKEESMDADVSSIATIAVRAAQKIFNKLPRLVTQMKHIISASAATKASSNTEGLSTPPGSHTAPAKRKRRSTSDFMQEVQTKLPAGLVEATGKSRRGNKRPGLTELLEAGFIASGKSNLAIYYADHVFIASLCRDGSIYEDATGLKFKSPSSWSIHAKRRLNKTKQGDTGWGSVVYTPKKCTLKVIQGHYQLFLQRRKAAAAAAASQVDPSRSNSPTTFSEVGSITTSSLAQSSSHLDLPDGVEATITDSSTNQGRKLACLAKRYDHCQQFGEPSAGPPILFAFVAGACSAWEAARLAERPPTSEKCYATLQREFLKACNVFIVSGQDGRGIIEVMPCPHRLEQ